MARPAKDNACFLSNSKALWKDEIALEVFPELNTLPSKTNKTRSYPSGHAAQSV